MTKIRRRDGETSPVSRTQHRHTLNLQNLISHFLRNCETKAANVSQTDRPSCAACAVLVQLYLSCSHQRSNAMYNGGPGGQPPPGQGAGGNPAGQPNNNAAAGGGVPPAGAAAQQAQHHGMLLRSIYLSWLIALHWFGYRINMRVTVWL